MDRRPIQIGGGFIQKIDLRLHRIDRCKCDLLLFPAGKGEDIAAKEIFDMQSFGGFCCTLLHLLARHGLILHAESNFTVRIHIEKLGPGILEYTSDLLRNAVQGKSCKIFAVQQNLSAPFSCEELRDQTVDEPRQRGLSAAAPTAEQNTLPVRNREINMLKTAVCMVGIVKGHILKFDHTNTSFHINSAIKNAKNSAIARKSAARIRIFTRQVRGLGFSMPRVMEAIDSSSAALLAAVKSGT